MSKTILTYQPYIEMEWYHITLLLIIVDELLKLVIKVATIYFMVATFVNYEKVLKNDVTHRKIFPTFRILIHILEQGRKI